MSVSVGLAFVVGAFGLVWAFGALKLVGFLGLPVSLQSISLVVAGAGVAARTIRVVVDATQIGL